MKLTAANIRTLKLPPGEIDRVFFDEDLPGFGLRVRASGVNSWMIQYAIAGRTRRVVLGLASALDPGKARSTAKDLLAQVRLGKDPASEKARDRVLTDQELAIIWRALEDDQFGAIIKLLLLTGARRTEIGSLRWDEVDLDAAIITMPPERTKNGREHIILLSEPALKIVRELSRRAMADGTPQKRVFGNGNGFQNWSRAKADLDARVHKAGHSLEHWTLHDLRRSVSTALHDRLGVLPHIVEALLGHAGGHKAGVAGTYNRAEYFEERRRALERWGAHLMSVVTGKPVKGKIVKLRRTVGEG